MALSRIRKTATGLTNQFAVAFALGYRSTTDVTARVVGEVSDRTINFAVPGFMTISGALVPVGVEVVFTRTTARSAVSVDWSGGANLTDTNMDTAQLNYMRLIHEALDGRFEPFTDNVYMSGYQIKNVGAPTEMGDVATMGYIDGLVGAAAIAQAAIDRAAVEANLVISNANTATSVANAASTTADAIATAADRIAVAADQSQVSLDKGIVLGYKNTVTADKATVNADKILVAADRVTVVASAAQVAADKLTVSGYMTTTAGYVTTTSGYMATTLTYRNSTLTYRNEAETFRNEAQAAAASLTPVADQITAAGASAILNDADTIGVVIAGVLKKVSWTNIKSKIKEYTDTLYREVLTANRTYYVRFDGSDTNTGLVDSAGGAFLTIAKATAVAQTIDPAIYTVIIQLQDGTWTTGISVGKAMLANAALLFRGNEGSPTSCVITDVTSVSAIGTGVVVNVSGVSLNGSLLGVNCVGGATVNLNTGIVFGSAATSAHIRVNGPGSNVNMNQPYTITAAGARHLYASPNGYINCFNRVVTLVGTLHFSSMFAFADRGALISTNASTFTGGTVTGKRYDGQTNAVIYTGGGASHYPGDVAGTVSTGAQYA